MQISSKQSCCAPKNSNRRVQ